MIVLRGEKGRSEILYGRCRPTLPPKLRLEDLVSAGRQPSTLNYSCTGMGNFLQSQQDRKDPCFESLNAYVSCVEKHQGQAPDPYETEWCLAEQAAYRACRNSLKKADQKVSGESKPRAQS